MYDTDSQLLHALVHGFVNAMLVSRCSDGLRSRPMTIAKTRDPNRLWLLCGALDDEFEELREDPAVQVILQDGGRFCAVTGTARVARLPRRKREAVSDFRGGGQQLLLLEVRPQFAEYWDRSGLQGLRLDPGGKSRGAQPIRAAGRSASGTPAELPLNVVAIETARKRK